MRKMVRVNCHQCKKRLVRTERELQSNHGRAFCSRSCAATWQFSGSNHPRWKGIGRVEITCLHCGKNVFVERNMKIRLNRRFCSHECSTKYIAAQTPKVFIDCVYCSKPIAVKANNSHSRKRRFCDQKCRAMFHRRVGSANPMWKGGISRERDVLKSSNEYKAWRIGVFTRDRFLCVVCLKPSTLNYPIEAHHLKPLKKHPALACDPDNGCTLCRRCHKHTYHLEELLEDFLRSRILRDFTSDSRSPLDIVKIKSELLGDKKRLAEMPSPALASA